ncbi:MAG: hypothetical protein K0V04_15510, partial [Deltaproteobacteria bacterium]|nr:hypothetical protein [Deltaproteobacteria bacterium]
MAGLLQFGCRPAAEPEDPVAPHYTDAATLAAVARHPDLSEIHRDLALLCPPQPGATHRLATARCSVSQIDGQGQLKPLDIESVLSVQRFDDQHVMVSTPDLHLQMLAADGTASHVASGVIDPRVADDGRHVAWVELVETATTYEGGAATQIVLWDAAADERWVVSDDTSDSSPVPVPGRPEVVVISRRSGLASYWLLGPQREPTQLTNVGLARGDEGFAPLHAGEFIWLTDGRAAVYSADYGEPELWRLDLDEPGARMLGPGRLPMLARNGVVAVTGHGDDVQVVE